jgi:hypothetical protein
MQIQLFKKSLVILGFGADATQRSHSATSVTSGMQISLIVACGFCLTQGRDGLTPGSLCVFATVGLFRFS